VRRKSDSVLRTWYKAGRDGKLLTGAVFETMAAWIDPETGIVKKIH